MSWQNGYTRYFDEADEQLELAEVPIVICWNGLHHYTPTAITSQTFIDTKRIQSGLKLLGNLAEIFDTFEFYHTDDIMKKQYKVLQDNVEDTTFLFKVCTENPNVDLSQLVMPSGKSVTTTISQTSQWSPQRILSEVIDDPNRGKQGPSSSAAVASSGPGGGSPSLSFSSAGPSSTPSADKRGNPSRPPPSATSGPASTAPPKKKRKVDLSKLQCKHCNHVCARSNEMGNHLRKDHGDLGYEKLKCQQCTSDFTSSQGLKVHMTSKHNVGNAKVYNCDKCDYVNNKEESLLVHKANKHGAAINKPQCEVCQKFFMHSDHLKKHIKDDRCMGPMDTEEEGAPSTRKIKEENSPMH